MDPLLDVVIDGFRTWDELEEHLTGAWYEVRDRVTGLAVLPDLDRLVVKEPASGTAKQRRSLHRAGFRQTEQRSWSWTPPEPVMNEPALPWTPALPGLRAGLDRFHRELSMDRARNAMTQRVLRDMYECAPANLIVGLDQEDDQWDGDADDEWEDDGVVADCATLEERCGSPRAR